MDEVEEAGEVGELVVEAVGLEAGAEGGDAGIAVEAEAVPDQVVGADEVGAEAEGGGDAAAG